eukprot:jgi/Botrbrau1/10298/Bobra.0120s0016.1
MAAVTVAVRTRQQVQHNPSLTSMDDIAAYALKLLRFKDKADRYLTRAKEEVLGTGNLHDVRCTSDGTSLTATCKGSGADYAVSVRLGTESPETSCSCPSAEKDRVCKHVLALLMWRASNFASAEEQGVVASASTDVTRSPGNLASAWTNGAPSHTNSALSFPNVAPPQADLAVLTATVAPASADAGTPGTMPSSTAAIGGGSEHVGVHVEGHVGPPGSSANLPPPTPSRRMPSWMKKPLAGDKLKAAKKEESHTAAKPEGISRGSGETSPGASGLGPVPKQATEAARVRSGPKQETLTLVSTPGRKQAMKAASTGEGPNGASTDAAGAPGPKQATGGTGETSAPKQATGETGKAPGPKRGTGGAGERSGPKQATRGTGEKPAPVRAGPRQTTLVLKKRPSGGPADSNEQETVPKKRAKRAKASAGSTTLSPIMCSPREMAETDPELLLQQARDYLASTGSTMHMDCSPGQICTTTFPPGSNHVSAVLQGNPPAQEGAEGPGRGAGGEGQGGTVPSTNLEGRHVSPSVLPQSQLVLPQSAALLQAILADTQLIGELSPRSEAARQKKLEGNDRIGFSGGSNLGGLPDSLTVMGAMPLQQEPARDAQPRDACLIYEGDETPNPAPSLNYAPQAAPGPSLLDIILAGDVAGSTTVVETPENCTASGAGTAVQQGGGFASDAAQPTEAVVMSESRAGPRACDSEGPHSRPGGQASKQASCTRHGHAFAPGRMEGPAGGGACDPAGRGSVAAGRDEAETGGVGVQKDSGGKALGERRGAGRQKEGGVGYNAGDDLAGFPDATSSGLNGVAAEDASRDGVAGGGGGGNGKPRPKLSLRERVRFMNTSA